MAEIYVPSVALFPNDLETRHQLLEPAREQGFRAGLMLVIRGPQDLTPENVQKQLDNLDRYVKLGEQERPVVFLMHPNKPLSGPNRLNFLDNPEWSQDYVEQSVELAAKLPGELTPETGRAVSFHLNTLVAPVNWVADPEYWNRAFETVESKIRAISEFASRYGVRVAIETTPITEFGDMHRSEETLMENGVFWDELGNPWPLLPWRDEIRKLREARAGLAIDWCHSWIAVNAVREVNDLAQQGKLGEALVTYMVFNSDLSNADTATENFSNQILRITQDKDIWHATDARDKYRTPELHRERTYYEEGVALFDGEIPPKDLEKLIKAGLKMPIKFVLEIHEEDFENNPNTKRSLAKVLQYKDK